MRAGDRAAYDRALRPARLRAYPRDGFVGQESFMQAAEILSLARRAGVAPGVSVLDLCCGVAGPGRLITAELGGEYLGVDASAGAVALARERAGSLPCRFEVCRVPPVPSGPFDVVLLLETMLAFADKTSLVRGIAAALAPGGRFAFTLEEGDPLSVEERGVMPGADTVRLTPLPEMVAALGDAGLRVRWMAECSRAHRLTAEALADAFDAERASLTRCLGRGVVDDLVLSHRLWGRWLREGRVRKFAVVAERPLVRTARFRAAP